MENYKKLLIKKLQEVKELYVQLEDYANANLIKLKIQELEQNDNEFNFTGNTGQINVAKGNSKINCIQNII